MLNAHGPMFVMFKVCSVRAKIGRQIQLEQPVQN